MLLGISLFTGYSGIDFALKKYVQPVLYCDIEKYSQAMLLTRMDDGSIPFAPIWTDARTLDGRKFRGLADAITAGFPCQGNSTAGKGLGLADERTGLFFEIIRIAEEVGPTFIFLENVAGIRTKESYVVKKELARLGFDVRWGVISAAEVGANHERKRYFCLAAHSDRVKLRDESWWLEWADREGATFFGDDGEDGNVADSHCKRLEGAKSFSRKISEQQLISDCDSEIPNSMREGCSGQAFTPSEKNNERIGEGDGGAVSAATERSWWEAEPNVGRVVNGPTIRLDQVEFMDGILVDKTTGEDVEEKVHNTFRKDRIKALGNGVVPLQVTTAFERLMGT